jgi:hypothetical protein
MANFPINEEQTRLESLTFGLYDKRTWESMQYLKVCFVQCSVTITKEDDRNNAEL